MIEKIMAKHLNSQFEAHKALLLLQRIPTGRVVSYKELARASGTSPRAVGQILRKNPYPEECPCYKVVSASGQLGGYCGQTSGKKIEEKIRLLRREGIPIKTNKISREYFWEF
jgi:O-6-methylguanine DNA methyltransferase